MLLKKSNILQILLIGLVSTSAYSLDILSDERLEVLKLSKEKALQDTKKLKIDWINPVYFKYTYLNNDASPINTRKSAILINQPVFRSGGIYSAIKYSDNLKQSSELSLYVQKKELIKNALNIAYNIKKIDTQILMQNLQLANSVIDVKIKKQSVFNGLLDISTFNTAVISYNAVALSLLDLKYQKNNLINGLKKLSTVPYDKIELPTLAMITANEFTNKNTNIQQNKIDIDTKKNLKWVVAAKYLPIVNVNYSKTKNYPTSRTDDAYGFDITVPLDFKGLYDTQASKLDYLKAKQEAIIIKNDELLFLNTQELKLQLLQDKIALTKDNISVFNDLLEQTQELAAVGIKTNDDVKVLQNSKQREALNLNLYELDKQIELLEIYARVQTEKI